MNRTTVQEVERAFGKYSMMSGPLRKHTINIVGISFPEGEISGDVALRAVNRSTARDQTTLTVDDILDALDGVS